MEHNLTQGGWNLYFPNVQCVFVPTPLIAMRLSNNLPMDLQSLFLYNFLFFPTVEIILLLYFVSYQSERGTRIKFFIPPSYKYFLERMGLGWEFNDY